MLPKDPYILLSTVNTYLRDSYASLGDLCGDKDEEEDALCQRLGEIGYVYDSEQNRFVGK